MITKMKGILKDRCAANYTLNTARMEMLFKSLYAWGPSPQCLLFFLLKGDRSPAPHLRKWKHHTQASKIDGKTCEWRTLFLFCSTIQRADSRGCFTMVELIQTWTSEGHHPPTGYGKRNWPRETWLMQGHTGVHRLNESGISTLPMSGFCFTSSCTSSLKAMTKQYKTKDLHCSSQRIQGRNTETAFSRSNSL